MKVHELIKELQMYDPNLDVLCFADNVNSIDWESYYVIMCIKYLDV